MNYLEIYKKQTILITGGAGAIGSNLARKLAESGAEKVIILDDLSASYEWNIPNLSNVLFVGKVSQPRPTATDILKVVVTMSPVMILNIPMNRMTKVILPMNS